MIKVQLKHNLRKYRKDAGLTLQEVADYLGVQKPTVQRYESGIVKNIPNDKIEKLAKLFNISTDELYGIVEQKPTEEDYEKWDSEYDAFNLNGQTHFFKTMQQMMPDVYELLMEYNDLNEEGKKQAVLRVRELGYIPEYKK